MHGHSNIKFTKYRVKMLHAPYATYKPIGPIALSRATGKNSDILLICGWRVIMWRLGKQRLAQCSIFRRFCRIAKQPLLAASYLSVRPSALDNWAPTGRILMNFDGGIYFENLSRRFKSKSDKNLSRKSVEKTQVSSKSGKNNGHFTCRYTSIEIYDTVSQSFSQNEKCFRQKL